MGTAKVKAETTDGSNLSVVFEVQITGLPVSTISLPAESSIIKTESMICHVLGIVLMKFIHNLNHSLFHSYCFLSIPQFTYTNPFLCRITFIKTTASCKLIFIICIIINYLLTEIPNGKACPFPVIEI